MDETNNRRQNVIKTSIEHFTSNTVNGKCVFICKIKRMVVNFKIIRKLFLQKLTIILAIKQIRS